MNFVIAAGGTGGHLFPGLAVGEVLIARGHRVMLIISEKEIDMLVNGMRNATDEVMAQLVKEGAWKP